MGWLSALEERGLRLSAAPPPADAGVRWCRCAAAGGRGGWPAHRTGPCPVVGDGRGSAAVWLIFNRASFDFSHPDCNHHLSYACCTRSCRTPLLLQNRL